MMAGYFRGWIDDLIQYLYTTLNSIPWVLLIAAAVLIAPGVYRANIPNSSIRWRHAPTFACWPLCVIIGLTSWTGLARLIGAKR